MTIVEMKSTNASQSRSIFQLFKDSQINISNYILPMEMQIFLQGVRKLAQDMNINEDILVERISNLVRGRFQIKLLNVIEHDFNNKSERKINFSIAPLTREQIDASNPIVQRATEKLMNVKGKIEYQKARGRAAKPLPEWLNENLIKSGILTPEELSALPMVAFQRFDPRLAKAFHNAKYSKGA